MDGFFDIKTLTDEELLERWHSLNKKILWAGRFGSAEMVGQMQSMKFAVEIEQRERIIAQRNKIITSLPTVGVETDPQLAAEHKAKITAEQEAKSKKTVRPSILAQQRHGSIRERLQATPNPVIDKDDKNE